MPTALPNAISPTSAIAADVVEPLISKRVSRPLATALAYRITTAIDARVAAMLTYGPDELARIARSSGLTIAQIETVLSAAGGRCVNDAGLANAWNNGIEAGAHLDLINETRQRVGREINALLHGSRNALRNRKIDTKHVSFDMINDGGYYAEAFGMVRTLATLGYGYLGASNGRDPLNLRAWFSTLEQNVLIDEGWFGKSHSCHYCLERYGKDSNGRA